MINTIICIEVLEMVIKIMEYYSTKESHRDIKKCRVTCEKIRGNRLACYGCENDMPVGIGIKVGFDYEYVTEEQMDEFEQIMKEKTGRPW